MEKEIGSAVTRVGVGMGELGEGGPKGQTCSYKIKKYQGCNANRMTTVTTIVWNG